MIRVFLFTCFFISISAYSTESIDPCENEISIEQHQNNRWLLNIDTSSENTKRDLLSIFEILSNDLFELKGSMRSLDFTTFTEDLDKISIIFGIKDEFLGNPIDESVKTLKFSSLKKLISIPGVSLECQFSFY